MKLSSAGFSPQPQEGEKKVLNSELWHACAGPLVSLPAEGSRVVYFPQGHSEQVAVSTNKEADIQIPNSPSLPPQLICQLHNVTMHADVETDEVYAQMTLQPLNLEEPKDPYLTAELGTLSKQPTNYFCKTLTASDTSTHGGFSVPRRAAEKVFPPLDFTQQPPAQELIARDLHDNEWKFRHIFRGQPKRHLLTTGWSVFVSAKRLVAGDSVLFIWNEKNQLFLGIRRANRPQTVMPSSVLSSDSMHLGLLAAAAHAAMMNSRFTIFYNPRACPSEFVVPLAKYIKAVYHTRVSVGMRFRMLFETEESSVRRYMGTITGVSDSDPARWQNSHWRSVKVGWDESTAGERQPRVSLWEIEPLTTFPMYPSPFPLRLKRPWPSGLPSLYGVKDGDLGMWLGGNNGDSGIASMNLQGFGVSPWLQPRVDASVLGLQTDMYQAMAAGALEEMRAVDPCKQTALQFQQPQYLPGQSAPLMQNQFMPPCQGAQENQHQSQSLSRYQAQVQSHALQQHLQHQNEVSSMSQFVSVSQAHPPSIPTLSQHQSLLDSNGNPVTGSVVSPLHSLAGSLPPNESSHLLNLVKTNLNPLIPSPTWPNKKVAVEPRMSCGGSQSSEDQLDPIQTNSSLPPFPAIDQEGSPDPQSNLLFGVNIDPSFLLLQNGISSNSTVMPFASSNFMTTPGPDFSHNPTTTQSSCIYKSDFLQSPGKEGQVNPSTKTFVKVYKSGSFGRSLDMGQFSSYHELRGELARMFGLEGQLEDPLRSGWQLVFVDRENDVLLLGDDPWQEFVNSVWCIKILSPQEVQQMGKRGLELLNSVPIQKLSSSPSRQDSKSLSSAITSVGGLLTDY